MVLMSDLGHSMSDMRVKLIMIFAVLCLLITPLSQAEPARLTIACAANFSATMNKLVELYVTQSQQKLDIRVSVGSSGALASQIHHGAPICAHWAPHNQQWLGLVYLSDCSTSDVNPGGTPWLTILVRGCEV